MTRSDRIALLPGVDVSRETELRLRQFVGLVEKWTTRINLVSAKSLSDIWSRHVLDSAQLYRLAPDKTQHWVDLGSGAGFPGVVISILAQDRIRPLRMTLVESDQRKAAFLRSAARDLGIGLQILTSRIEQTPGLNADVLSARALGALPVLLSYADRHLSKSGTALFPKGRSAPDEIVAAKADWRFHVVSHPSMTDPDAQILQVENVVHV